MVAFKRVLKNGGLLFVQGLPRYLSKIGVFLDRLFNFKYWIAVESEVRQFTSGLPSSHVGVLLFVKGNRFHVERVRFPHQYCAACGKTLRDWGGKAHLMHPEGVAISDVWTELPKVNNYATITQPVLDKILSLLPMSSCGLVCRGLEFASSPKNTCKPEVVQAEIISQPTSPKRKELPNNMVNVVYCGDVFDVLRQYPDECIDLAFADPPYNLKKAYAAYEDSLIEQEYIEWCNSWLMEYIRVLKPTGSLYVLNLPRWGMHHAVFLNKHLQFQNWIVWDALSEPRGKIMPAHYSLLFYTKHPTSFTFNYKEVAEIDARNYCLRLSCIKKRKQAGDDKKEQLTDIWWDIHRIKHRRNRDYHPCQLPDSLLERIIRLSSNPGDVILDAFCGVGATLLAASKLGRRYIGIEIDPKYVEITKRKLGELEEKGFITREKTRKKTTQYTQKELQLELKALAANLGRLPTKEDVERLSRFSLHDFLAVFPTWSKALKAAKIEVSADK